MSDISSKKKSVSFDPFAGPEISRVFPLTESQIEIWLSCTLGGDHANIAYNESNSLRFEGALDVEALAKAVGILTERHESLRCSFSKDGKSMLVYKDLPDQFLFQDISGLPARNKEASLKDHLKRDAQHNFDLVNGPLFKATLLKLGEQEYHFTFTAHHIIIDGWSIGLIMEELGTLYSDIVQGKEPDLPDPYAYSDYANEQREFLNSEAYKEVENFWLDQYKDKVPVVNLPTDHARPLFKTYASNRLDYELEHSLVKAIRKTGIESGCTLVNTILGALEVFLSKVTGQKDIIVGVPASGQAHLGYHQLLGHCVNLLPLRSQPDGALGFGQYLSRRKPAIFDAYENQQLTFGSLLKNLKVPRDTSRVPLVPVVFNVDFGMDEGVHFHGLKFKMISNPKSYLNFEWFLNINGSKESVVLEWTYNKQLFEADTMNKMVNGFVTLLKSVTDDPDRPLDTIEIFVEESPKTSPGEEPLLYAPDFSEFQPMHSLFELAAEKCGERPAVSFRDADISYRALNEHANQLAHFLAQQGLKRGEIVGIVMDRSIEMLVAALGILKAGCAYLPVDTDYPNGRIEYYLNDGAKMHITQKIYQNTFNSDSSEIIWEDFIVQKEQYPKTNPNIPVAPHDKAYIIYTSGSTGGPKGVILEHDNLFNFLVGVSVTPGITQEDRVLAVSSFSFDIAIQELILPLVHGAQIFILDKNQRRDPREILSMVEREKITLMFATPTHWKMMLDSDWHRPFPDLNIACGGEQLSPQLAGRLINMGKSFWNIYGPTETTVFSTVKKIESLDEPITIGRPICNTEIYILDENLKPVATNVEGEIVIGGRGVARGYLNLPELTAEKFIVDPFKPGQNGKMYRTGDLGKILANGELAILGRIDHQVKLRGHRIELGEIESSLAQLEDIKDAVVLLREDEPEHPRLTAYLVLNGTKPVGNRGVARNSLEVPRGKLKAWRNALQDRLPDYMIPADFVIMEQFPINNNGKIDRKALPPPNSEGVNANPAVHLAETPEEILVARIWGEALGIKQVDITDNFFEIGGHSMIAVQVMSRLEKESNIKLPISVLFKYPTVQELALFLSSEEKKQSWNSLVPIKPHGSKTPLYIVHGGGLNVMPFYSIAKHLDPDQPLYGIQAYGLNGVDKPFTTVEGIAGQYVEEILAQNPNGPYALAGYSFGGLIAFEMAKQLKSMGKEIKALVMFDTYAIKSYHRDPLWLRVAHLVRTEIGKRIFDLEMLIKNPKLLKRVKKISFQKKIGKIKKQLKVEQEQEDSEIIRIIKNIKKVHKAAGENYVLTPYDGEIHLFRAKIRTSYLKDFKYFGWKPYVKKVHITEMEGEHTTMFEPPNEKNFVKILQEILDNA